MRIIVAGIVCFISTSVICKGESIANLQALVDEAMRSGRAEVVLPPGEHTLLKPLVIHGGKNLRITAADRERTILRLPPLAFARASKTAMPGDMSIETAKQQNLVPGTQLHIEADGEIDSFSKQAKPYHLAILKGVDGNKLLLQGPLKFAIPPDTLIRDANAPNLIEIRDGSQNIMIDNLTLDGGRTNGDPPLRGHAQLCGVFVAGRYTYEAGPSGPPVRNICVTRCTIHNCFGRGVAFYSVERPMVEDCDISDANDEAIDLDHFCTGAIVRSNRLRRTLLGVELNDASDCLIENNTIAECGTGVHIWRWCKQPGLNERNRITGNTFINIRGNAVQIAAGAADNRIEGNTIDGAGRNGITLAGERQIVTGNQIRNIKLKPINVQAGTHTIE